MFQTFHTHTLMSDFIKNLLSNKLVPIYDIIDEDDLLVSGGVYIYKQYIIKCVVTGVFKVDQQETLYPSDKLYPSLVLYPNMGEPVARYRVVRWYDQNCPKSNRTFMSNLSYYDSSTHKHLGDYLRFVKYHKGLDLMPYYNCFTYEDTNDVYIKVPTEESPASYVIGSNPDYKILSVPITFDTDYTIAIDCPSEVLVRCVILDDTIGLIPLPSSSKTATKSYYSDYSDLDVSFKRYASLSFHKPVRYNVSTTNIDLYSRQRNLRLLIQLPRNNTSSIVVLEGDYTEDHSKIIRTTEDCVLIPTMKSCPNSLLMYNTTKSYAFSNRLIEYLLLNVIHEQDELYENIRRVQKIFGDPDTGIDANYKNLVKHNLVSLGVWDDGIKDAVIRLINKHRDKYFLVDMNGHINKDVEELLYKEISSR